MLAWLALALQPLALLGSEQPNAEVGNTSALVGATLLGGLPPNGLLFLFSDPFLDPNYEPPNSLLFLGFLFWTSTMEPNSLFSPYLL